MIEVQLTAYDVNGKAVTFAMGIATTRRAALAAANAGMAARIRTTAGYAARIRSFNFAVL